MAIWFWYGIAAAILYGLHQVFTKLAATCISDGLGALVVEGSATVTIVIYLVFLWLNNSWAQKATAVGVWYSILTGVCVGAGTVMFFLLFQKGGPLSAVPMVLAGGAAFMAICGILFFKESASWPRLLGVAFSIAGLLLLRYSAEK